MDTLEYPVRPICQPKPHYSLVNYSSSEDDFVTVLDDEDDNEGDENDENEEEGVEDEGFDRAWQNAIDVYGPLTLPMRILIRPLTTTVHLLMRILIRGKMPWTTTVYLPMRISIRGKMPWTTTACLPMIPDPFSHHLTPMKMNDRDIGQTFRHLQKTYILRQMKLLLRSIALRQYMAMRYQ
jgi:hypothetical protein